MKRKIMAVIVLCMILTGCNNETDLWSKDVSMLTEEYCLSVATKAINDEEYGLALKYLDPVRYEVKSQCLEEIAICYSENEDWSAVQDVIDTIKKYNEEDAESLGAKLNVSLH